jgi:endonuclease/exonuclease/phosphatase (EEP) superfamily protein YafD
MPIAPEPPKKRKNRDWSSATLALLVGCIGLGLGRLGHLWIRFDVFSQFAIQFLLLAVAAALGMFSPRFKGLVGSILFVLFICMYGLWPQITHGGTESALAEGEKRLRVAQFNIHGGNVHVDQMIATVKALNPDVMTLVEFDASNKPVLEGLKNDYPFQHTCWELPACDFTIISKTPLINRTERVHWEGSGFIQANLGPEFGNLTVVGVHTTRFPDAVKQFAQVNALAKYLETVPGKMLVMGDFNATPFSRVIQNFANSLELTRQTSLPSWPSKFGFPQLAIDHIFTSAGIRAIDNERIGDSAGSDHYPVAITLAVPTK